MNIYTRQSKEFNLTKLDSQILTHLKLHYDYYGLDKLHLKSEYCVCTHSISTKKQGFLFWKRAIHIKTYTFYTELFLVNIIINNSKIGVISINYKNIIKLKNYEPIKIGQTLVQDSGITIYGMLNGLGMTEVRTKISSIFIGIEKGDCYDKIIELFNDKYYKLNNFTA